MTSYELYADAPLTVRDTFNREMVKRAEDVVLGSLLIMVFSWLLIAVAIGIKLTSPGPVFFMQERRGRNGTTFRCFKFRSMHHKDTDHSCRIQTSRNDPRITTIGRVLRKTSLDELPQLFNVVLGDMSLVGPRPHALSTSVNGRLLDEIADNYHRRYAVKPGITGLAQVSGSRGILVTDEQVHQRVRYDLHYIANWSLWLDVKILFQTFTCVLTKEAF